VGVAADLLSSPGGSFDDLPDAELRTSLAVPLTFPETSEPGLSQPVPPPLLPAGAPPGRRTSRRGRHRAVVVPDTGPMSTVRLGLSAAAVVFVVVAALLLAAELFLR
jgi:hypothetical protein